ncbi:DUF1810 domain-containing protein [Pedobacter metabolipauper]|uniref:Uncharacterized protein (DUF1810 family) n=1 Tax=Pedobacter metabolipauper TaxID=425513 RepID=A0A4R6SZJ4_9SPHI|nr:DUF1810 domain-containing protein [Pedobacter metabolipauper]TDQ11189.1 uncharacterized protein (DUF1810 family) [Pedobacter metabolipauper]
MEDHNLERFVAAQKSVFQTVLSELQNGRKQSHWMWYVFPQIQGLGFSETSKFYAIQDMNEAEAYLNHRVLGPRLIMVSEMILKLEGTNAYQIFGSPDDVKLHSSMTLFASVPGSHPVFEKVLKQFFNGLKDCKTLKIIGLLKHQ